VPTEFQNFWTIIKRVIAKMVSVGPPCTVCPRMEFVYKRKQMILRKSSSFFALFETHIFVFKTSYSTQKRAYHHQNKMQKQYFT
jgi:hypothetical protein